MQYKKTPSPEFVSSTESYVRNNPEAKVIWERLRDSDTGTQDQEETDDEEEQGTQ